MAEVHDRVRKMNYRVSGSSAYDYRRLERPSVRLPEEKTQVAAKPVRRRATVSPVIVLGIAVLAFMAVLIVFCYVRIYETDLAIASLRTQLTELEDSHARLEGIYESQKDMLALNERAEELGMHRITQAEIVYLDLCGADHADITPAERKNAFSKVFTAIRSSIRDFLEYLP